MCLSPCFGPLVRHTGTVLLGTHGDVSFVSVSRRLSEAPGYISVLCGLSEDLGYVSVLCGLSEAPGYVSVLCGLSENPGYVSVLCGLSETPGYVSVLCGLFEDPGYLSSKASVYATFPGRKKGYRTVSPCFRMLLFLFCFDSAIDNRSTASGNPADLSNGCSPGIHLL